MNEQPEEVKKLIEEAALAIEVIDADELEEFARSLEEERDGEAEDRE